MMQLDPMDEFPFHQHPAAFNVPAVSDVHFNDGYFFAIVGQRSYLSAGIRLHPNMNVIDGWAGLVRRGEERVVRFSRALRPGFTEMRIGALAVTVVEPMRRIRIALEESPIDLAFDVELRSDGPPFLEPRYQHRKYGHLINDVVRYSHHAHASGSVTSQGESFEIDNWLAVRDHSWGVRSAMGPRTPHGGGVRPADEIDERRFRIWAHFEVGGYSGFFQTHEAEDGTPLDFAGRLTARTGDSIDLVAVSHKIEYFEGTRNFRDGWFRVEDADGNAHEFRIELDGTPVDLQGFGYHGGWDDGGSAGVFRGVGPHVEHDVYGVDPSTGRTGPDRVDPSRRLGATEYPCRVTDEDGNVGTAHFEHNLMGRFLPYLDASTSAPKVR